MIKMEIMQIMQIMQKIQIIQKKKKKKTITLFIKINKEKGIIVFPKKFAEKHKNKMKIIYDNKKF